MTPMDPEQPVQTTSCMANWANLLRAATSSSSKSSDILPSICFGNGQFLHIAHLNAKALIVCVKTESLHPDLRDNW